MQTSLIQAPPLRVPSPPPEPVHLDRFVGDYTGLVIPAREASLREDGTDFLTRALRAFGTLGADNRVTAIVSLTPCPGGSTGAKLFLEVAYERPVAGLHTALFVKFSRDFSDRRRDHPGRYEMAAEVPFMALARQPGFPIAVAAPYFADYDMETGTGLVITQTIPFGPDGIEPHREKCLDFQTMDDPLPYYRATITALARLSGAHKAGHLAADMDAIFPFDPVTGNADPIRYDEAALDAELRYGRDFVLRAPQHFPASVRDPAFLDRLAEDARMIRRHEPAIREWLTRDPDLIALCHWNAHIDNAFFWREDHTLRCGFIDWGRVGQITLGSALWGGLSAAHHDIWDHHLDELLALFAEEYRKAGGPTISVAALEQHLMVHIATMGVARVLAFPEIVAFRCPEVHELSGPHDAAILPIQAARNTLHVYTVFLKLWHARDLGGRMRRALGLERGRD